jgi:prepilin-type processing-associated H-X9-DG protein
MDLRLYMRVLWRFRLLTVCGVLLALSLSFLAYVNVAFADGRVRLTYRESEQWASYTKLFVTQQGFPWGYSVTPNADATDSAVPPSDADLRFADQARFTNLAVLYSQLATSDPVRRIIREDGPVRGTVIAAPVLALNNPGNPLPIISLAGISDSPARARQLAMRATAAMQTYLRRQQQTNEIPERDRVEVQILESPRRAQLFQGRSMTLPVILFLTLMIATTGLAFVLENVRPAPRPVIVAEADEPSVRSRRSA